MSYPVASPQDRFNFAKGAYHAGDHAAAARRYEVLAAEGSAGAQNNLGLLYNKGQGGLPKDGKMALRLCSQAAEQRTPVAFYNLSVLHATGAASRPAALVKAWEYLTTAAENGFAKAQRELGDSYYHGAFLKIPVPKNDDHAVYWLRKAAKQDEPYAMCSLAHMHLEERGGLPHDEMRIGQLVQRAADKGVDEAKYMQAEFQLNGSYGIEKDPAMAVRTFRTLAKKGSAASLVMLAEEYKYGNPAVRPSKSKAAILYYLAEAALDGQGRQSKASAHVAANIASLSKLERAWGRRGAERILAVRHKPV